MRALVKRAMALLMMLVMAAGTAVPAEAPPRCDINIIVDTSPATRYVHSEMMAVAEAGIEAAKPGDRIRLIAGHPSRASTLLIQEVTTREAAIAAGRRALRTIHAKVFWPSDLAAALDVPLASLRAQHDSRAVVTAVLVVTNGRLSDKRTRDLIAKAEQIKAAGGRVLVTGVRDSSTGLLAAAAEGRIRWTLLSKSDPAQWIAQVRGAVSSAARRTASDPPKPNEHPWQTWITYLNSIHVLYDRSKDSNEGTVRSEKPKPQQPTVPLRPKPSTPAPKPTKILPKNSAPVVPVQKKAGPGPARTSLLGRALHILVEDKWKLLGLLAGAPLLALAILITRDRIRVMHRRAARPSLGLPRNQATFSLVAAVNGHEHVLGKLDRLNKVRVGRDGANAVVLDAPGVERHHFQLARRGRRWLLENLSRKPLDANGSPVAAGKAAAIEFPAHVRLGDQANVRFLIRAESSKEQAKPASPSVTPGSLAHEGNAPVHVA